MLKNIPTSLPPELLKILMEMGHGDEIIIADRNFSPASHAQRLMRCDGHNAPPLLDAILQLLPLDTFVNHPVALMAVVLGDKSSSGIWPSYKIVQKHDPHFTGFEMMGRHVFYLRPRKDSAIVATREMARYANLGLKKGLVA